MFEKKILPKILENLSNYKINILKEKINGIYIYNRNGKRNELPLPYILPENKHYFKNEKNILSEIREDFLCSKYRNIKPHRYFHHLNSSQAMCINFFYPLIKNQLLENILSFLNIDDTVDYDNVEFEKYSKIEKTGRKTNFDFYIKTKKGINLFFEIKYTERKFGSAKNDEHHRNKFKSDYMPALKKSTHISEPYHDEKLFFENYQVLRNILNIDKNSYVIFLYLKDNEKLKDKCNEIKTKILNNELKYNFKDIDWFELYDYIIKKLDETENSELEYYQNFYTKYLSYEKIFKGDNSATADNTA